MKGVLKIRNIDSLSKLSYKRAKGKRTYLGYIQKDINKTILTLEKLNLLTPEMLWDLISKLKYFQIESRKLQYVMLCRKHSQPVTLKYLDDYLSYLANSKRPILNVPYEIKDKYKAYIYSKSK